MKRFFEQDFSHTSRISAILAGFQPYFFLCPVILYPGMLLCPAGFPYLVESKQGFPYLVESKQRSRKKMMISPGKAQRKDQEKMRDCKT